MLLRDIIKAEKVVSDWGQWHAGGRMPKTAFCLSRPRGRFYRLGAYRWRVIRFEALGAAFRLLIAYHGDKEQYRAVLAIEHDRDMAVLAQYEFHGTHPGWHVLATCDDVDDAPAGMMRHPGQRRLPRARAYHRGVDFRVSSDDKALAVAAELFRLHNAGGSLV